MKQKNIHMYLSLRRYRKYLLEERPRYILLGFSAVFLMCVVYGFSFATEQHKALEAYTKHPDDKTTLTIDLPLIQEYIQKYQELSWFSPLQVKEADFEEKHPSTKIFGRHAKSFDRAIMGLKTIRLFLEGKYEDYLEFVLDQPKEKRLEWIDFQDLQAHLKEVIREIKGISTQEIISVLEVAAILHEMGGCEIARNKGWIYDIHEKEESAFVRQILVKHPEIFPSFEAFTLPMKKLCTQVYLLASLEEEASHLYHAHSAFEEVKKYPALLEDPECFELAFFLNLAFIASHKGDQNPFSSTLFTKYAYRNLQAVKKAFFLLKENDEKDAYQFYLNKRADWLDFDVDSPLNRILTMIGSMMELYTVQEGKILKESFLKLSPEELSLIVGELNSMEKEYDWKSMTTFLTTLSENGLLGKTAKDRLAASILMGFPFFVKVVHAKKAKGGVGIVHFEEVAFLILKDPFLLKTADIEIDKEGAVQLKQIHPSIL